ncbi:metallophosphoesterase family protein [Cellulosilyticum ruminicola]|uniref:metallophosphoesterase family protein n=1 Tax=Cellulosilyticum ruminicola TaxID=425254 RepID=UPI0006D263BA|nr:metallophosphoesterase family protein [Cellulosilyticum ruminicola]
MAYNKVAIISDLHANLYMLDTFLAYVEKEKIELVINLGDFISEGPYPYEVLKKVLEDKRFVNIMGYDEARMIEDGTPEDKAGTLAWTKDKLDKRALNKLRELPTIKSIEIGNMKILMMHLNGFVEISQKIAHSSSKIVDGESYTYIFCGGGHLQQFTHAKEPFFNTNIIEPGALMKDENDRGHFAVLEIKDNKPKIVFESILCKEVYSTQEQVEVKEPYLIEEVNLKKDINLHIYDEAKEGNSRVYKEEIMKQVLELGFSRAQYISIGCWVTETEKVKELLFYLKCRRTKFCEKSGQQWYIGEITSEIKKYVQEEINKCEEKLKWFEILFLENVYSVKPIYSIYHYGKACLVNQMFNHELYNMEEKLKANKIIYEINAWESKKAKVSK